MLVFENKTPNNCENIDFIFLFSPFTLSHPIHAIQYSICFISCHHTSEITLYNTEFNLGFLTLAAYWGYRYYYCMDHLVLLCMGREFNYQVLEPLGVGISAAVLEILGFYWLLGRHEEH